MPTSSGKAHPAPFRIFFASIACVVIPVQSALAQTAAKPGPMQSGTHTSRTAEAPPMDVGKLFATSCGWCHSGGGRDHGKGPRLMGSELTDDQIMSRIRNGKTGQMPAYSGAFTDAQLRAIVAYIRNLKPEPATGKEGK
jgi:mono/diheme cytochrome c family protein